MALISVGEAQDRIAGVPFELGTEQRALVDAAGWVLARSLVADRDAPPFDRVAMDGIAFASAVAEAGRRVFRIAGIQAAGAAAQQLADPESCLEVMTGAPLPGGADCVVPVENLRIVDGCAELGPDATWGPNQFVHPQASDRAAGEEVLPAGVRLRAPQLAVAASYGATTLAVRARPRLAVISNGDELVPVAETPAPHQIRRSNPVALAAALAAHGFSPVQQAHAADDPDAVRSAVAQGLTAADVVVLTGGVSKGRYDYIPGVLADAGVACLLHGIAQRPGKPMWFGQTESGKLVFALPGNPVSALVCTRRYVVPRLLQAETGAWPVCPRVRLTARYAFAPALGLFLPVCTDPTGNAEVVPAPTNGSGDYVGLARSDGFVEVPAAEADVGPEQWLDYYDW